MFFAVRCGFSGAGAVRCGAVRKILVRCGAVREKAGAVVHYYLLWIDPNVNKVYAPNVPKYYGVVFKSLGVAGFKNI